MDVLLWSLVFLAVVLVIAIPQIRRDRIRHARLQQRRREARDASLTTPARPRQRRPKSLWAALTPAGRTGAKIGALLVAIPCGAFMGLAVLTGLYASPEIWLANMGVNLLLGVVAAALVLLGATVGAVIGQALAPSPHGDA